jgi:RNase H-like domain found in reverse transcriptase
VVPLTQLTQKNIPWNFDESCKLAFLTLKQAFISAPVLTHYKPGCPLVIETDASDYALAAILSQVEFNGEIHPVTYLSRTFSDTELNYDTHDKELVTTLILNEYRQSSNSSVLVFKLEAQRLLRMPIARYCLSVELVRVRSSLDS